MKGFTKCIILFSMAICIWADVPPETQAFLEVHVVNSQGQNVSGAVIYWAAQPMIANTGDHQHGGPLPKMTLQNPSVNYSYTNSQGIAYFTFNTPEYSGHYPWTATCPACKNWQTGDTVYVDFGYTYLQLPFNGAGFTTQYDSGHPDVDYSVSNFMNSKAQTIGTLYAASTLSHDGVAKTLVFTRTGIRWHGTLDNNWGAYFEIRSNPDPHLDLREVIDIVWPGGNDSNLLTYILNNITTSGGHLGWAWYGVGNNLQGQNILHADGT